MLRNDEDQDHRVIVALRGTRSNRYGVGARVRLESALGEQTRDLVLARGYLSTSEPVRALWAGEGHADQAADGALAKRAEAEFHGPAGGPALHDHGAVDPGREAGGPGCSPRPASSRR